MKRAITTVLTLAVVAMTVGLFVIKPAVESAQAGFDNFSEQIGERAGDQLSQMLDQTTTGR